MFSYAVKNATVIDGTRCKPYKANVYIAGDAIAEITAEEREAERSFDAAGLVASNSGTTTITNCVVSTVIHSSVSGDGSHGGIYWTSDVPSRVIMATMTRASP